MRTASGLMYSEQGLSRGNAARSTASTENPLSARSPATALPAGPAPAMRTSTSRGKSVKLVPQRPCEQRRKGGCEAVHRVVVEPCQSSPELRLTPAAVLLPLTVLPAMETIEASLQGSPEQRVHQHPCETYQHCSEGEPRAPGHQGRGQTHDAGTDESSGDASHRHPSACTSRHRAIIPEESGRRGTEQSDRSCRGVGSGRRQARRDQPDGEQRVRAGYHRCDRRRTP